MRFKLAILVARITKMILVLFNKRGGSLPGKLGMKIDPNIMNNIKYPNTIILVTGTNGKTTTTNMIYQVLIKEYNKVLGNIGGDNLYAGINTLLLLNTNFKGIINADAIVLEVDELSVNKVMKSIPVTHFILLNLFRDQLDRAGEMQIIINRFESILEYYKGSIILNGDDPNVFRLGYNKDNVYYFSSSKQYDAKNTSNEATEGKFCFICNNLLEYDYYQYSHIGSFKCNNCKYDNNKSYIKAYDLDHNNYHFIVDNYRFNNPYKNIYSLYNCLSVITLSKLLNINYDKVNQVLDTFKMNDGRMEEFYINRKLILNLIKNPTGANEVIKIINKDNTNKDIWIILNDNGQDGRDVSWIYDVKFELLNNSNINNVICSGTRGYDLALALKYNNIDNIIVFDNDKKAYEYIKGLSNICYVLATYTALQKTRKLLKGK